MKSAFTNFFTRYTGSNPWNCSSGQVVMFETMYKCSASPVENRADAKERPKAVSSEAVQKYCAGYWWNFMVERAAYSGEYFRRG